METRETTYLEAVSEGLRQEMIRDVDVIVLGEDVAGDFGGAFKVTEGFTSTFGDDRVLNTPAGRTGFHRHGHGHGPDGPAAGDRGAVRRLQQFRLRQHRLVRGDDSLPVGGTSAVGHSSSE